MSLEPPSSSGLPGRSRPALSDLSRETTEGDLWNLDDELADRPAISPPPVDYPPKPRKGLEPVPEPEKEQVAPVEPAAPRPRGRTPAQSRSDHDDPLGRRPGRSSSLDEIGDLEEETDDEEDEEDGEEDAELRILPLEAPPEPVATQAEPPAATSQPAPPKENQRRSSAASGLAGASAPRARLNRREVIGIAAFAFTLLLAAIWVVTRFFSAFEFKSEFVEGPDFPIKGERVQLERAETFWRQPVRTGDNRDFARREVTMIPVLELTLDPDKSTSGTLLVIYRNSEAEPVGDSIRRSFTGARFDTSGNATIAFPSTDGFVAEGDFNAYRAGKGEAWMAEVFEGPSIDAPADQFKLIASIPVLPKLR